MAVLSPITSMYGSELTQLRYTGSSFRTVAREELLYNGSFDGVASSN